MHDLDHLLEKTSRTFALSIPLLPEPTRRQVTVAYLLFRIADTLEDAAAWPRERRLAALGAFADLLAPASADAAAARRLAARWSEGAPSEHRGYLELLAALPTVLAAFAALDRPAREVIARDTERTARGMAGFVARSDAAGRLQLADEADLGAYCYVVAGIVGEMLTELFLLGQPALGADAAALRQRAARFGEALQLVNILKDAATDVEEGRRFLPPRVAAATVFRRARADLEAAAEYVLLLQEGMRRGVDRGLVAFCALPVRLAWATLERVESAGAGAKLTRPEVFAIVGDLEAALDAGAPAVGGVAAVASSPPRARRDG